MRKQRIVDMNQLSLKMQQKCRIFSVKVLEIQIKVIPLHPLSRTNLISQMNRTKLASVMSWRKFVLNERNLKQNELRLDEESVKKKEFFEKIYIRQIK